MSAHSVTEPSPASKWIAGILVGLYAVITLIPLIWIISTSFKSGPDSISYPPKVVFQPTLEGYVNLFTTQSRASVEDLAKLPAPTTWYDKITRERGMIISGPSRFGQRFLNSVIIGFFATILATTLGTLAALGLAIAVFGTPVE